MTHTTQDGAELREALADILRQDTHCVATTPLVSKLEKFVQASQQQLLTELLALGRGYTFQNGSKDRMLPISVIEKYREGLHESHD